MRLANFSREWSENGRLRAGVVFIIALGWIYGLLAVDEALSQRRAETARLDMEITRLALLARGREWPSLRDQAIRRLSEFRARVWREESEGHIQAAFQDWLHGLSVQHGLKASEISVTLLTPTSSTEPDKSDSPLAGLPPEMRMVRARMVAEFQPRSFVDLLASIAATEHWVWVERLSVRNWGSPRVELELGAMFAVGARDRS